jgi:hypothetical protein
MFLKEITHSRDMLPNRQAVPRPKTTNSLIPRSKQAKYHCNKVQKVSSRHQILNITPESLNVPRILLIPLDIGRAEVLGQRNKLENLGFAVELRFSNEALSPTRWQYQSEV